jgi:PAS domain S-box-containing protein
MISVLYVDDEQGFLEIAQLFLEQSGDFSVKTAISAQEALECPAIRSCDAIVSDYQMPGMDGIAFLKAVRERFGDIPFILFTGRGREEVVIEAINNGADFYLQKGGDPTAQFAELAHKIRHAVGRKRAENSLRDSERRLSDIINFLPDPTFAIDRSGLVIAWNRAIEDMTGTSAREILGKGNFAYSVLFYGSRRPSLINLIDEPDEKILHYYSNLFRAGNSLMAETEIPHAKGHRISALIRTGPLYNSAGEIIGAIESFRDITEIKKSELDLRAAYEQITASEEELRSQYDELKIINKELTTARQELSRQLDHLAESERTLRVNEERLAMAQKIGQTGSWEYKIETNTIWGSAEGLRIFGYPAVAGDFPLDDIEACIPDRERVHQALVDLIKNGQEYNLEYAINPADGSAPKVIHSIARLEKDAGGRLVRVTGVIQDITERRRADEEITFKNILLLTQQETSSDGILVVDEPGKILNYNRKFTELWNVPEGLIAAGIDEPVLQHVEQQLADPEAFLARVTYLYEHKDEKSFDEILLKDGRVLERFSAPMLGEERKYYGRVWYFRDITGREQVERKLRESEEKYRLLTENSQDITYTIDLQGTITYVSRNVARYGFPPEYFLSRNIAGVIVEEDLGRVQKDIQTTISSGKSTHTAFRFRDSAGNTVWFEDNATVTKDASGNVTGISGVLRDITERKKTEEALTESERKFRTIFENSPYPIAINSIPDNKFLDVNAAFLKACGYTETEILGKNPVEAGLLSLMDVGRLASRMVLTGKLENVPLALTGKGGRRIHVLFSTMPATINNTPAVVTVTAEVTQLKRIEEELIRKNEELHEACEKISVTEEEIRENYDTLINQEKALRESEEKYRDIFNNTNDAIQIIELDEEGNAGRFIDVNEPTCRMLHYTYDEMLQTSLSDIEMNYSHKSIDGIEKEMRLSGSLTFETELVRKDGVHIPVEVSVHPVILTGRHVGISVVRNITERRKSETALRENEEKFRALVETSPDIIWEIDPQGNMRYISPMVETILGYTLEELEGKPITSLIPEQARPLVMQELARLASSEGPCVSLEVPVHSRNGRDRVIEIRPSRIKDTDGKLIGLRGVAIDVTERRKSEEALRRANRQLNLLGSVTRHDLLNKITVVLGYLKIVQKRCTDPGQAGYLGKMESTIATIRSQIEFTRVYQSLGTQEPQWTELDMIMPRSQVPSPVILDADVSGVQVFADAMLEKVFFNLLDNSLRHGKHVTEIRVSYSNEGTDLVVVWEDNGIGIAADEKERIFEQGFGKNTGLGMFLAREILTLTGITIRETGEPGSGARFEIVVPEGAYRVAGAIGRSPPSTPA